MMICPNANTCEDKNCLSKQLHEYSEICNLDEYWTKCPNCVYYDTFLQQYE